LDNSIVVIGTALVEPVHTLLWWLMLSWSSLQRGLVESMAFNGLSTNIFGKPYAIGF